LRDDPLAPMRRFVRPSATRPEADPFLCRHLLAKDPTRYACLRTMRPDGPDGGPAAPEGCNDDRICFEATVKRGGDS
jgi:hypothetical protein